MLKRPGGRNWIRGHDQVHEILEAAVGIGDLLLERSLCTTQGARWPAPFDRRQVGNVEVGSFPHGSLYDGCAGIASALVSLEALCPGRGYREAAFHAIAEARHWIRTSGFCGAGLFTGRAGVALCALRAGEALAQDDLRDAAIQEFDELIDELETDRLRCSDVISGDAGIILALLSIPESSPIAIRAVEAACKLGDRLLGTAHRTVRGWQWDDEIYSSDGLTGYAHGVSGVAHALIALASHPLAFRYSRTGKYFAAALLALEYERSHFVMEKGNWADLRVDPEATNDHGRARSELLAVWASVEQAKRCMVAWCHGAPGSCIPRAALLRHLNDESTRNEIDIAVNTLCNNLGSISERASLCHAAPGNADILQSIISDLPSTTLASRALACIGHTTHRILAQLPSLIRAHLQDQSFGLMTGLSGILHFLLRSVRPDTPSWLFIEPPSVRNPLQSVEFASDVESLLGEEARRCMPRVRQIYGGKTGGRICIGTRSLEQSTRLIQAAAMQDMCDHQSSPTVRNALWGALTLDVHEKGLMASVDRLRDRLEASVSARENEPLGDDDLLMLSGRARVVDESPVASCTVLVRSALIVKEHPLGLLARAILSAVRQPITKLDLWARLIRKDCTVSDRDRLESLILSQISALRDAGILIHVRAASVTGEAR